MENREEIALSSQMRKTKLWRSREQRKHLKRQLEITDRLLNIVDNALQDERELFKYVTVTKSSGISETVCEYMQAVNEDRLSKIVKALAELIGLQHEILAVPLFKEGSDAENSRAKIESDRDISLRKLELELLKLDGGESQAMPEELLAALSGDNDDP